MGRRFTTLVAGLGLMAGSLTTAAFTAAPAGAGMLSPIMVNDLAGADVAADGKCQLSEAITAANNDAQEDACGPNGTDFDTIVFSSPAPFPPAGATITLSGDLDPITESVVIDGPAPAEGKVIVSGNDARRILDLSAGDLIVKDVTLTHGKATGGSGGAIRATGDVLATDVTFDANDATNGSGGAISANNVSVNRGAFTNNTVTGAVVTDGGGAIRSAAGVSVTGPATFSSNSVAVHGAGGAIRAGGGVGLTGDVDFSLNGASGDSAQGGCVFSQAALNTTTAAGSQYTSNTAALDGGCLYSASNVTLDGGLFKSNASVGLKGGAVAGNANISVTGATFGGPDLSDANLGWVGGGAIAKLGDGEVTITSSIFEGNFASHGNGGAGGGGAIFVETPTNTGSPHSLTVSLSTFKGNGAGDSTFVINGGALLVQDADVTINSSTFEANVASGQGGALSDEGVQPVAGTNNDTLDVSATTFTGNQGQRNGGGGALALNDVEATVLESTFRTNSSGSSTGTGGGIAVGADADLRVENSTFFDNVTAANATGGAAIGTTSSSTGNVDIAHATMSGNRTIIDGAGTLSHQGSGAMTLTGSVVADTSEIFASTNCLGTITGNYDMESAAASTGSTCPTGAQNKADGPVLLNAIADNGDSSTPHTETMAPQPGSPLINGVTGGCPPPAGDQRGVARPTNLCDIGAVELPATVDLLARKGGSGAYQHDNVYLPTPERMNFSLGRNKSTDLYVKIENEGPARTFRFKGSATDPTGAFKLQYLLGTSTTDVTAQVTSAQGYLTPSIAPGATKTIRVKTTIKKTAKAGVSRKHTYTATATNDAAVKDQITSTITVTP